MQATLFTWSELALHSDGNWRGAPLPAESSGIRGINTDSRHVGPGELFLALRGEHFDGHRFVDAALAKGAAAACVAAEAVSTLQTPGPLLVVQDTLKAYQYLARAHRRRFPDLVVVGVTGSSGKTSMKEMMRAVLETHFDGHILATEGNTNNHIGVPQNLLRLTADHRAAVMEMGTSSPGEIAVLAELTEPDLSILTNIGPVHLEGLGDLQGVAREKAAVFSTLGAGETAVVPVEALQYAPIRDLAPGIRRWTFGFTADADVRAEYLGGGLDGSRFRLHSGETVPLEVSWPLQGRHQAGNAAGAAAAARALGVRPETIRTGLARTRLPGMRMLVEEIDDICWINDAYNANLDSMKALINWLADDYAPGLEGQLHLVLGDMLELGAAEESAHRELVSYASERLPKARLIGIGPRIAGAAADAGARTFPSTEEAKVVRQELTPGDTVVLKASRGMHLEALVPRQGD